MSIAESARMRVSAIMDCTTRQVNKIAVRAWNLGVRRKYTKGNLRQWLDKTYAIHHAETEIRVYKDCAFMFLHGELVDIEMIPTRFRNN